MSPENRKIILAAAREAGDFLKGKLPEIDGHPARNSYAHVFERVKHHMGMSYKDCTDEDVQKILDLIVFYRSNPS